MEAISPPFAAVKERVATPVAATGPLGGGPSVIVPLKFILFGIASLLGGTAMLVLRPDLLATYHYNQHIIAVTHLFVLGWIASVVMGAMYQLVPVALETKLFSERLTRWHFWLHAIGLAGMVWMLWIWNMKEVGHFGSVVGAGIVLFAVNIGRTMARIPRWNVIAAAIASALTWLTLGMMAGLFIAVDKCWTLSWFEPLAQMHAHAHLGVVGFFIMMIVGVSYKLIPMFTLSDIQNRKRAGLSVVLLNAGLAGASIAILLQHWSKILFAAGIALALALYLVELAAILRARKRITLDWGLRTFLAAIALIPPLALLGMVLAWPGLPLTQLTGQLENVYGFLALGGVVTLAIAGMLYKIVPFLVWYSSYSNAIGRYRVPALCDLYSAPLQIGSFFLMLAGVVAVSFATAFGHETAVRFSSALLMAGFVIFAVNMAKILTHFIRPRLVPLPKPVS